MSSTPPPSATPPPASPEPGGEADLKTLLAEPTQQIWYQRPVLWFGALFLILVAAGLWYWQARRADNAAPIYSTQTVARGNLTLTVTANGTLQPTRTINIGSELSGTVRKVNVDVNDRLTKGQVLVELDPSKLNDQILGSRASVAAARALVGQTVATVKESTASLARLEAVARLSGGKVPSKAELDSGRATHERAMADETSARAGVANALATLSTNQINLDKASIRAPSNGIVLTRSVEPGNAVAASLQAVTLFSVAEDLSALRLQVYVDEADVGSVKVGQNAVFTVSAYPSRQYPAQITRVAFGSTITDNVVTYLTYLGVDNTDLTLRPGMTATATITAKQRSDVLLVPNTALRFSPVSSRAEAPAASSGIAASLIPRGPTRNAKKSAADNASTAAARQVWVLRDDVAVSVAVMPGISDGRMTEIVSGELVAGMQVITDQKSAATK
ncbi:MAG: efflux RND transporter periplasmic adaptor subunit [Azonexus sp.]|nr:efflux RND transporter periplasmic adaptor subunit [Azonexus sp.]